MGFAGFAGFEGRDSVSKDIRERGFATDETATGGEVVGGGDGEVLDSLSETFVSLDTTVISIRRDPKMAVMWGH